jgi:hypothetical protein
LTELGDQQIISPGKKMCVRSKPIYFCKDTAQEASLLEIPFTHRVVVPDAVLERGIGNESIILNLDTERYFGLDEMGRTIWQTLETSSTIQEAFERLLTTHEVDESTLRADMIEFIGALAEQGLVELHAPDAG